MFVYHFVKHVINMSQGKLWHIYACRFLFLFGIVKFGSWRVLFFCLSFTVSNFSLYECVYFCCWFRYFFFIYILFRYQFFFDSHSVRTHFHEKLLAINQ